MTEEQEFFEKSMQEAADCLAAAENQYGNQNTDFNALYYVQVAQVNALMAIASQLNEIKETLKSKD